MWRGLALASVLLPSLLYAQEASETDQRSVATQYAEAVVDGCLPLARGEISFSGSVVEDQLVIDELNFENGINEGIHNRFSLQDSGVLNRSIMGHRLAGDGVIVLAVGGQLPGCKVILLMPEEGFLADEVSTALSVLEPQWRELPFGRNRPGTSITKRSFIMRDWEGTPFLINLISPQVPNSQLRLLATLSPVPASVQIPEGY